MVGVLIMLTTGPGNELIDYPKASVQIAVVPMMYVKTQGDLILKLLQYACQL